MNKWNYPGLQSGGEEQKRINRAKARHFFGCLKSRSEAGDKAFCTPCNDYFIELIIPAHQMTNQHG